MKQNISLGMAEEITPATVSEECRRNAGQIASEIYDHLDV
jgi:hypothetical protein